MEGFDAGVWWLGYVAVCCFIYAVLRAWQLFKA